MGNASSATASRVACNCEITPSEDLKFAGAVAAFGMLLRNSPHRGQATYTSVLTDAGDALGADPGGYRAEFLRLVEAAQALSRPVADPRQ